MYEFTKTLYKFSLLCYNNAKIQADGDEKGQGLL